ncbi:GLPGLI family protein [uncultured Duncaniella sp.]|uniref:GLPGLI family protein n=1 Tax=uncultured Duncaniella sp. TaxID=2768039 RepID=UPI00272CAD1B|nr:GLPGLI family protein [uncultured Duncaniella sp.]
MNRLILFVTIISSLVAKGYAQRIEPKEPAMFEVLFTKHVVKDTVSEVEEHPWPDAQMALRVGKTSAMFYPVLKFFRDSLAHYNPDLYWQLDRANFEEERRTKVWKPLGGWEWEYVFKNMPEGKWTVLNYFDMERRVYEEEIETPVWEIADSVKTILGYECQLAFTDFRGRRWSAWFTPEIPVAEGPWKLSGLPGLILEAYDAKRHYVFTSTGIVKDNLGDVGIYIFRDYFKTTRDKYLNDRYKYITSTTSMGSKIAAAYGVKTNTDNAPKKVNRTPYDFEETNYPH